MRFSCSLAHFSAAGDGSRLYGFAGGAERPSVTTSKRDNTDKKHDLSLKREFITHLRWRGRESETRGPRNQECNQTADEDVPRPRDLRAHEEHVKHHRAAHDHAD